MALLAICDIHSLGWMPTWARGTRWCCCMALLMLIQTNSGGPCGLRGRMDPGHFSPGPASHNTPSSITLFHSLLRLAWEWDVGKGRCAVACEGWQ